MRLLALFVLFAASLAHADNIRVEAGGGTCRATKSVEGTWWQQSEEHHLQMRDRCGEVGVSWDTPISNVSLRAHAVTLGQFSTHARANADDGDNAARRGLVSSDNRRPECAVRFAADCLYQWDGFGEAPGYLFALGWEPLRVGPVRVGGEVGQYVYKARWRETIHPIDCPANQCWQMQIDQRTGWQHAMEFGVSARWEYFYVKARRFEVPAHAPITAGFRAPIYQFLAGVSIPL